MIFSILLDTLSKFSTTSVLTAMKIRGFGRFWPVRVPCNCLVMLLAEFCYVRAGERLATSEFSALGELCDTFTATFLFELCSRYNRVLLVRALVLRAPYSSSESHGRSTANDRKCFNGIFGGLAAR